MPVEFENTCPDHAFEKLNPKPAIEQEHAFPITVREPKQPKIEEKKPTSQPSKP